MRSWAFRSKTVSELVAEVQKDGIVSVANHNTQQQIVITGAPPAVEQVSSMAVAKGAKSVPLKVSGAWHSELIKGAQDEFKEFLGTIGFEAPQSRFFLMSPRPRKKIRPKSEISWPASCAAPCAGTTQ